MVLDPSSGKCVEPYTPCNQVCLPGTHDPLKFLTGKTALPYF
ncbi:hypothetical protein NBRC3257_0905 [Gluconobacter thailandicus NBRC 3257]|uniref:Uncharacterized protein n=1 Tax=Gluconobacter thailandicus NBRC 3257 TaxID=1381097 RepID=A0ABQ0IUN6_GLUTH|nr:hypothetical protein NBRC3255_0006 [Gluconobacter thailandicus NBRC 3255]GAD25906.1 hypothetical protein NBRC3257_0905 [Gluconobacter thailandicus NBRC 3257]